MFNTNKYIAGDIKINACSGGIYKTYKESWFDTIRLDSRKSSTLFKNNDWSEHDNLYKNVVIIQMILLGEDKVLAELIKKDDFDKYFETKQVLEEE